MTGRRLLLVALVLVTAAALLASCGGEDESAGTGDHVTVRMFDNRYEFEEIRIPVGGSVTFLGAGRAPHNAVAADGSWSTEDVFGSLDQYDGDEATLTFDEPGEWLFFCTYHGNPEGGGMAARLVVGEAGASAAAQGAADTDAPGSWSGVTRSVPDDYPTIQAAVDAADPGDLVLVGPGVYREEVQVTTPGLVIRGTDRNEVVIDGEFQRPNGIVVFGADGVAVENLTARNATGNGVFWTGVRGFRGSYLTAIDNGKYGIYAFDSSDGRFEHSYASGSADGGFYVGQCDPCETIVTSSVAEWNGIGYSGSNSSGDMYILDSVWRNNAVGVVPNSIDGELLPPVHDVTVMGNLVYHNGVREVPAVPWAWAGLGNGIILAGTEDSLVARNRVVDHPVSGIAITPNLDRNFWMPSGNVVRDNVVEGSGRSDLALTGPARSGNCFEGNTYGTSLPVGLEVLQPCEGLRFPALYELGGSTEQLGRVMDNGLGTRPDVAVGTMPEPGPLPQMPGGVDAPVVPAVDVFASTPLDLETIDVPDLPDGVVVDQTKGVTVFGVLIGSVTSVFFGLYAYLLPFVLYAAWVAIAFWDLARRDDLGKAGTIGWLAVILLVPFLGVILYHALGRSPIPGWQRAAFVGGGLAAYLVVFVAGLVIGGVV